MNIPQGFFYTKEHEWISVEGEVGTIGITDHAQKELGDVVYVDLPEVGAGFRAEEAFGSVESVKAVSEVYSPVSGKVVEVNGNLQDSPEAINQDPYGKGWIIRVRLDDTTEVHNLMAAADYERYLEEEAGE